MLAQRLTRNALLSCPPCMPHPQLSIRAFSSRLNAAGLAVNRARLRLSHVQESHRHVHLQHTSLGAIPVIHTELNATFTSGLMRPLSFRRQQLLQLARMLQDNKELWFAALRSDLGRHDQESALHELGPIVNRCLRSAEKLEDWARPFVPVDVPEFQKGWAPMAHVGPKGVVLLISPWNCPVILSLQPLLGAIAAGCPAVLKPSELAPATSQLLGDLIPKYLDSRAYRVVNGAIEETNKLLELRWDHIFYTGNSTVARVVAAAAAKHLTPLSLELGGKSPVVVDGACDLELAAKRILWGKTQSAGQVCVTADYVLVPQEHEAALIDHLRAAYASAFPEDQGALYSPSFASIVNERHFDRLKKMLDETRGEVVFGGRTDRLLLRFEPAVVRGIDPEDSTMRAEIFGPVLPIVALPSEKFLDEAIAYINARDHPLALYAFTEDPTWKDRLLAETRSGSLVFNDIIMQLASDELPMTGIGESGYGNQIMRFTFDGFSHLRSSVNIPNEAESMIATRYQPYRAGSDGYKQAMTFLEIDIPRK